MIFVYLNSRYTLLFYMYTYLKKLSFSSFIFSASLALYFIKRSISCRFSSYKFITFK